MIGSCVTLLFVLSALSDAKEFRCDYTFYNGADGWLKFHEIPANWEEARLRCHLEGATLASPVINIKEAMLQYLATKIINIPRRLHTGIHSFFSKGDYATIEGVPLRKIPYQWAVGEPDNHNDTENCIAMMSDGKLADVNCADTLSYMCYKKDHHFRRNVCGTIDPEYTMDTRTGSCYKFHRVPRMWSYAYKACMAEGGYLAIINSEIESEVIKDIFSRNPEGSMVGNFVKRFAYVGNHGWKQKGEWLTIHGETLNDAGFSNFSSGEPNNPMIYVHCGGVLSTGLLNDITCEHHYAFICEKSPDSLEDCVDTNTGNGLLGNSQSSL